MEITWRGGKFEDTCLAIVCATVCVSTTGLGQVAITVHCAWLGVINAGVILFIIMQAFNVHASKQLAKAVRCALSEPKLKLVDTFALVCTRHIPRKVHVLTTIFVVRLRPNSYPNFRTGSDSHLVFGLQPNSHPAQRGVENF
jgi:hypothetical protein